jgi:hypothetical protein
MRAFSSGSAALTGIEAVSNGVPTLKPPESRNANIVLFWMVAILGTFFLGTSILAHELGVVPSESQTIVAQVAETVFGQTPLFYMVQLATMMILVLAANTSFAGLPSLASVMARDRVIPRQFAFRGDRLAFSHGIIVLGIAAATLIVIFGADTHRLVPLYAVGVFVGFTLAQAGLVLHWRKENSRSARTSLAINALGAVITGAVTIIVAATKFVDGAWITLGGILLLTLFFSRIHAHYKDVSDQLRIAGAPALPPLRDDRGAGRPVILPVDELNQAVLRTVEYARTISDNITAVHVTDSFDDGEAVREAWEAAVSDVPIVVVESPYRSLLAPMLTYIDAVDQLDPGSYITVILPEFVPAHFWEGLLHNQSAQRLKRALLHRPNTVLIDVPYQLRG